MIIELQSKLSGSNSLSYRAGKKGPFSRMRMKYGDFENGLGARFEGDDPPPPEMKSWLRHWLWILRILLFSKGKVFYQFLDATDGQMHKHHFWIVTYHLVNM